MPSAVANSILRKFAGLERYLLVDYGIDPIVAVKIFDFKRGDGGYTCLAWKVPSASGSEEYVEYMDLVELPGGKWDMQNDSCGPVTLRAWREARPAQGADHLVDRQGCYL